MHRDAVPRYPQFVEKLGHSDLCEVQGIYVKNRVISIQGHPEYNPKFANILLDRRRGSLLTETTWQDAKNRVNNPHDGVTVAVSFMKFLLEDLE
jgi:GMP synthase-like glutamine amidotransferase